MCPIWMVSSSEMSLFHRLALRMRITRTWQIQSSLIFQMPRDIKYSEWKFQESSLLLFFIFQGDFHYVYSECDENQDRWRVAVPSTDCQGGTVPVPSKAPKCGEWSEEHFPRENKVHLNIINFYSIPHPSLSPQSTCSFALQCLEHLVKLLRTVTLSQTGTTVPSPSKHSRVW